MTDQISYARVKSDAESASSYTQRKKAKHDQEMAMIAAAVGMTEDVMTVLDAPCGVGRASIWLAGKGYEVTGIDLGEAALILARQLAREAGVSAQFESRDVFSLPYKDRTFDATLCFRLIHHFESATLQQRLLRELCRVSEQYLLVSRISPLSVTSMRRAFRHRFAGRPIKQYPISAQNLDETMAQEGFVPVGQIGRFALFHSLQLHVYRRK